MKLLTFRKKEWMEKMLDSDRQELLLLPQARTHGQYFELDWHGLGAWIEEAAGIYSGDI